MGWFKWDLKRHPVTPSERKLLCVIFFAVCEHEAFGGRRRATYTSSAAFRFLKTTNASQRTLRTDRHDYVEATVHEATPHSCRKVPVGGLRTHFTL